MNQIEIFKSNLHLDNDMKSYLNESAKWAKFLGIMGFIGTGFFLLIILIFIYANSQVSSNISNINPLFVGAGVGSLISIYILIAILVFFVSLFTFKFGQQSQKAISIDNQADLKKGMSNLRYIFRFYGIFLIIYIVLILTMAVMASRLSYF